MLRVSYTDPTLPILFKHIWNYFKKNLKFNLKKEESTNVSDPYSSNPDPAKYLNPDPVPDPDPSYWYFLPLSEFFFIR